MMNNPTQDVLSDQEMDRLIEDSFQREALLEEISATVMADVRRQARQALLRHWLRLSAFAFGVPAVLGCFGYGIRYAFTHVEMQPAVVVGLLLSVVTMVMLTLEAVRNFSVSEV